MAAPSNLSTRRHIEVVFTFTISTNWAVFMSLWCNAKINIPTMYEVLDKDTTTSEILRHLSVAERGKLSKSESSEVIQCGLHKQKTTCRWPITSAFPWCCSRCPWAACPATACASRHKPTFFSFVTHSRVSAINLFCLVFGKEFNIMSALFVHQSLTLPQKIDSRGGLFWC